MKITNETPRVARSIGGKHETAGERRVTVQVPQPYTPGPRELSEGEASALNQIVAENLSNNLRARIVEGRKVGEGDNATFEPFTDAQAQELVDSYLAEYEIGVRRAGSGERQVTDPVEREARSIARAKARQLIKDSGGKPADFDLAPIVDRIFEANKDVLMKEGKRIVDQANKAQGALSLEGIELVKKAASTASETGSEGESEDDEAAADAEEPATA